MNPPNFKQEAETIFDELVATRRDLHQHPELGFEETRTAGIVAERLNEYGLEVQAGVGQTGVVGLLEGSKEGPTVLLRFDMDALPIQEETGLPSVHKTPASCTPAATMGTQQWAWGWPKSCPVTRNPWQAGSNLCSSLGKKALAELSP